MNQWPFDEPENVATMTIRQVIHGGQPILYVSHDADDGMWQFLTGGPVTTADAMIVLLMRYTPSTHPSVSWQTFL